MTDTHGQTGGADRTTADEQLERALADGDLSAIEQRLTERGEAYATATVVRREPPVSANVGDRAIVTQDGELYGWIGGVSCAQSIVAEQATDAIAAGAARLIGIAPDPEAIDRPGLNAFEMRCHSEGVLELFIEPNAPDPTIVVAGNSPIAKSLLELLGSLSASVVHVTTEDKPESDGAQTVLAETDPAAIAAAVGPAPIVVAATMGAFDARVIAAGLAANARYIGLVASDKRAAEVTERAAELADVDPDTVAEAVTTPAGVSIAAYTPAEIAVSVLAEIVDVRARSGAVDASSGAKAVDDELAAAIDGAEDATAIDEDQQEVIDEDQQEAIDEDRTEAAIDPVCGMTVEPADASATAEHDGATYYFCCHGCADRFEADPESYLETEQPQGVSG